MIRTITATTAFILLSFAPIVGYRAYAEDVSKPSSGRVTEYLERAGEDLSKSRFTRARNYAIKALEEDAGSTAARDMLGDIDLAEALYREGKRKKAAGPVVSQGQDRRDIQAGEAAKQYAADQEKSRRESRKVLEYTGTAREYMSKGDYLNARKYAHKAREVDPTDGDVAELITDLNTEEMFGSREDETTEQERKIQRNLEKTEGKDSFYKYDEGKGWIDRVKGLFEKKTYDLGDVVQDGRTYTMEECVRLALARSQRMKVAEAQLKLAHMRIWEARRELFPEVTGKYEISSGKIPANSYNRHYKGNKYNVELKHTLFDGMGTWYKLMQTQTNLEVVMLEKEKIVNELTEETKKAYISLDKAIKGGEIQKKLKVKCDEYLNISEKSVQEELVPKVEYLKIKGHKLQVDFQNVSSREDISLAELILFQAMNMEPDHRIDIVPLPDPGEPLTIGLENCYSLAMANRPNFRIKKKTIEYYQFERKMMKAKGWPKITFQGSFGAAMENYQPLFLPDDDDSDDAGNPSRRGRVMEPEWFAGIKGSLPVWGNTVEYNYVREKWAPTVSAFRGSETATSYFTVKLLDDLEYFSNLQDAKGGFENAKYEYLKAKKDLLIEVKEGYFRYRKALIQMNVAKAKLEHQNMGMAITEERVRYGEAEMSKVLEESEKLATDEYGFVQSHSSYYTSLAELNKIIGLPDYFRSEHEQSGYKKWKKEEDAKLTVAVKAPVETRTGKAPTGGKHWFWNLFSGKK